MTFEELYALLVTYQALRTAIADAARASFSAARDQVIMAVSVTADPGRVARPRSQLFSVL